MNEPLGPPSLILLAMPAIALRIAVRALYSRQRLAAADPMQMVLSMSSTILFVLAAAGVGLGVWILLIPLPIAVVIVMLMVVDRTRHSEHRALIWTLATAAERGIPLAESARAYADETLGDTGARALALAEAIERGEPLEAAVRSARLRMGTAMRLAIRLGESLGALGPAMRQQLADSQRIDAELRGVIGRVIYLANVVLVIIVVANFLTLRIMPVFVKMFEEFEMKLPPVTRAFINFSRWFVQGGGLLASPLLLLIPVFFLLSLLYYVGWLPRSLPVVWRLRRRYDGALVMRALALGARRELPMPQAMQLVAQQYPLSAVGTRLGRAADQVAGGTDWCQALQQQKLIGAADAAVLAAAQRVGNLPWALEQMADSAIRRQVQWLQAWFHFLLPLVLLMLAAVVLLFAAGVFLPLVTLIQGLA